MTIYELAEAIHEKLCRWNHVDGCTWFYEDKDSKWFEYSHAKYLDKARYVYAVTGLEIDDLVKVFKAV